MKLDGTKVVVVGMARSGLAAVELLEERGAHVTRVDKNAAQIGVLPQTEAAFAHAELIVLSPGVPANLAELESARQRGVPVIGDLELASWFLEGRIIGITGSNGKTTTTALTGHILKSCGIAAQVGGNIGTPPASMVKTSRADQWNVLELSSFQLETIQSFRANIGAVLNITPDHLDRHYTFERYVAAKARLFENQRAGDFAVLNADDAATQGLARDAPILYQVLSNQVPQKPTGGSAADTLGKPGVRPTLAGKTVWFSSTRSVPPGAWIEGDRIVVDGDPLMKSCEVPLRGRHNLENTMAAALIAGLAGAAREKIRAAVTTFPGVEHRLEFVRELNGIAWYNDSKATNVDATLKAIDAFPAGLWVILGGKDKNTDYSPLAEPLRQKAHAVLLIGAAAEKIESQLQGATPMIVCGTLETAVAEARMRARPGDTVLLAPACASFDQFENFEHRGREFKRLVEEVTHGAA